MTKDKKNKKYQELTDVSAEVKIIDENKIINVTDVELSETSSTGSSEMYLSNTTIDADGNKQEVQTNYTLTPDYKKEYEFLNIFDLSNLRTKMSQNCSVKDMANDMKNFIVDNYQTNPQFVQLAIMQLLNNAEEHYDKGTGNIFGISGFTREHQGDNFEEILGKILKTPENEMIEGFVCSTIHEFGMHLLTECGIEASLLCGGTSDKADHTTLLWKNSDGKYVHNNYGESYSLNSADWESAVKEIYKNGYGLYNMGYIYSVDMNGSVQKCIMGEVSAVGEKELDKSDYENKSLFENNVAKSSSIKGTTSLSSQGRISMNVNGTLAYEDGVLGNINKERSWEIGVKKLGSTSLADSSTSVGGKYEYKKERLLDKGKNFNSTKIIADLTTLKTNEHTIGYNNIQPSTGISCKNQDEINSFREYWSAMFDQENLSKKSMLEDLKNLESTIIITIADGSTYTYDEIMNSTDISADIKDSVNQVVNSYKERAAELEDFVNNYDKYKQDYVNEKIDKFLKSETVEEESSAVYKNNGFSMTHLTTFIRQVFGKERTVIKGKNFELKDGFQVSGLIGFNKVIGNSAFGGDARVTAEAGTQFNIFNKNTQFKTDLAAGVIGDFALKTGCLTPTINYGTKFNAKSAVIHKVNDNVTFGASAKGYGVVTGIKSGTGMFDYGAEGEIKTYIRPKNSNYTIFGGIQAGIDKQKINVGGFKNELIKHNTNLGAYIGIANKKGDFVKFNFKDEHNNLNSTYNKQTYSITGSLVL